MCTQQAKNCQLTKTATEIWTGGWQVIVAVQKRHVGVGALRRKRRKSPARRQHAAGQEVEEGGELHGSYNHLLRRKPCYSYQSIPDLAYVEADYRDGSDCVSTLYMTGRPVWTAKPL
jgi:hypothetical protein